LLFKISFIIYQSDIFNILRPVDYDTEKINFSGDITVYLLKNIKLKESMLCYEKCIHKRKLHVLT